MNNSSYKKTIFTYTLFFVSSRILLFTPIFMLFYMSKGLTINNITMLKSLTFFTVIVLEVPSGALADLMSRKLTIIMSLILFSLSCFINAFSSTLFMFSISAFLWGAGIAFISGSDTSWLYNYLDKNKKANEFSKIIGRLSFINQVSVSIGLGISSLLFSYNNSLPYILNGIIFLISLFFVLKLENDSKEKVRKTLNYHEYMKQLKKGLYFIYKSHEIKIIFLYNLVFMSFTIFIFDTYQIYLNSISFNVNYIGILYAVFIIMSGLASKFTYKLNSYIKCKLSFIFYIVLAQGILSILLFLLYQEWVIIILIFAIQEILFGVFIVYSNSILNEAITSEQRTTILSCSSFFNSIFKSILFPVAGFSVDKFAINVTYLFMGFSIVLLSLLIKAVGRNVKLHSN